MIDINKDMTVGELLSKCGMELEDLEAICSEFMAKGAIDTEGELISEELVGNDEDVIDTVGFGIIPGGKEAETKSNIEKVANLFSRKLRKVGA
jgi:hypothetical protein